MLLLTGATGLVGSALLRRLLADPAATGSSAGAAQQVRCLVRDPRRLGPLRVRVQIALGDLADPPSFRNAMRGVDTVVHLASCTRDEPRGSIEELAAIATWRMVQAAQRAGVERFVFFSVLGASEHHRCRLFRAKALAEQAVRESEMRTSILAPSLVYAPGDRWTGLIERLALLPVVPVSGRGKAVCQPIWAEDVADCAMAVLRGDRSQSGDGARIDGASSAHYELAGPETLSYDDVIRTVLSASGRERPLLHVPTPLVSRTLRAFERMAGESRGGWVPITWDEAELLEANLIAKDGTADARGLGVTPQRMSAVLEN
jgi:NADH dehydrogenase